MTQERKKANQERKKKSEMSSGFRKIPAIVSHYSGTGYMEARELVGNHHRQTYINYNKVEKNMKLLISYMKSHNLPVLYKGFKGVNAEKLRTQGYFNAKTPTSTSTNKFQAEMFSIPGGILLTLPAKKRLSIVQNHLVKARQPREKEVLLSPQRFYLKNYEHINYKKK